MPATLFFLRKARQKTRSTLLLKSMIRRGRYELVKMPTIFLRNHKLILQGAKNAFAP